jgi:hypothetical protein
MKRHSLPFALALPLAAFCNPAFAQNWEYSVALYGWGPDTGVTIDTPLGEVSGELSFSEAWEALDLAFMGVATAQRGKLSFILDTVYLELSDDRATPGVLGFAGATINSQVSITNTYVMWEVMNEGTSRFDLGAGVRFYNTDTDAALIGGPVPASFNIGDDWIDPVFAVRYRNDFSSDWYATFFADAGGFGTGSEFTWQGVATVGYRFTDSFSLEAGYRILRSDRIEANGSIDLDLSGPLIGARFRF